MHKHSDHYFCKGQIGALNKRTSKFSVEIEKVFELFIKSASGSLCQMRFGVLHASMRKNSKITFVANKIFN